MSELSIGSGDYDPPQINISVTDVAHTQRVIDDVIGYYEKRIPEDEAVRERYFAQFSSDNDNSHKIDVICWTWAEIPERVDDAANLRSLVLLRSLQRDIVAGVPEKSYRLPVGLDPAFWLAVDRHLYESLNLVRLQHEIPVMAPLESADDELHAVGFFNDTLLYRQALYGEMTTGDHIVYGFVYRDIS